MPATVSMTEENLYAKGRFECNKGFFKAHADKWPVPLVEFEKMLSARAAGKHVQKMYREMRHHRMEV